MKKFKINLFVKVLMAIAAGALLGMVAPDFLVRILKTFNVLFAQVLKFVVPLLVLGLVTPAIANVGKNAGKMLLTVMVVAYISTICAGFFSHAVSSNIFPLYLSKGELSTDIVKAKEFIPFIELKIPPVCDILTALLLSFMIGVGIIFTDAGALKKAFNEFGNIVKITIEKVIIPLLPWYILAMMAGMTAGGKIVSLLVVFLCMILVSWAVTLAYLVLMYCVTGAYARRNPFKALWGMRSAYLTAFATCSSAASIPVSLENVKGLGVRDEVAELVVPLCATIHLAGSMIKLVCCATAFILLSGGTVGVGSMSAFIFVMTVTAIAAPGVPGGVITSSLGALASILFLTPEQCSMLMTVYLAMDGVGSSCSVGGHGAIALAVDRIR